jgi:hypothetical protein
MMYKIELTPEFHRIGLLIAVASSKERMAATGIIVGLLCRDQIEACHIVAAYEFSVFCL